MRAFFLLILVNFLFLSNGLTAGTLDQIPHLKSLPDSTVVLQQMIDEQDGNLLLGNDDVLRITQPLVFDLAKHKAVAVKATGGLTIVMDGPGPALRFLGSHQGTASPASFVPATWNERMPTVSGIEILGNHAEADGIELVQTVGAIVSGVSVRWCRHGIHLVNRNRNVLVSACHLYENSGVGVYLDDVNLHQINIGTSHISYNRQGGIVVRDGNVRNLQVSGCDIEGNMPDDETPTKVANILIDVSGSPDTREKSIAEISITGCTIQHSANYGSGETKLVAPGGANIRLAGKETYPIDSVTITGNVLSDTTTNIDIDYALDVAINGRGFLEVLQPDGTTAYTRNGQLHLSRDGEIVNADGLVIQPAITVPEGAQSLTIGKDGTVSVVLPGEAEAQQIGSLTLTDFINSAGLQAIGGNLFLETTASGSPTNGTPGLDGLGTIEQGNLENSNVEVVEELVNMITTQRAYEMNAKVISTSDQMLAYITQNL